MPKTIVIPSTSHARHQRRVTTQSKTTRDTWYEYLGVSELLEPGQLLAGSVVSEFLGTVIFEMLHVGIITEASNS